MPLKPRKRCTSNPVKEDLQNIVLIIIALAVIAVVWTAITILIYAITFWFITVPALLCAGYVWYKKQDHIVPERKPTRSTINTIEETKINQGTKKVHTTETYEPNIKISSKIVDSMIRWF